VVATYKLKEDNQGRVKIAFYKSLPLELLTLLPFLLMAFIIRDKFPFLIYIFLIVFILAIFYYDYPSSKKRSAFLLTLNQDSIKIYQSVKGNISIGKDDIKFIIDEGSGLRIKSIDPSVVIFIPNDLEDYDKLKLELGSWALIESGRKNIKHKVIIPIFACIMLTGGYLTKNPIFGYALISLLAGFLVFIYYQNFKTMMVTKDRTKRIKIVVSFILFGLLILVYILKLII
jgi:hypothetical protein